MPKHCLVCGRNLGGAIKRYLGAGEAVCEDEIGCYRRLVSRRPKLERRMFRMLGAR